MTAERRRVAVVGAGIGGMAVGMELRDAGIDDFVLLERSDGVGGTWRHNTYPGAACDVPSHLYSFASLPNPDWSQAYAEQPEILAYLERCADERGLRRHLRTGWAVASATWSDETRTWTLTSEAGATVEADLAVFATGLFDAPRLPDIDGIGTFAGPVLHSARWDHDVDLTGRRIGVIGTGASGVQIVPAIVERAARTVVFQRTPPYVLPRKNPPFTAEQRARFAEDADELARVRAEIHDVFESTTAFRLGDPTAGLITGIALEHLERRVEDLDLRAKLTPGYALGCNRTLISSDWYRALLRDDVELVTEAIRAVGPQAIETADGRRHPLDVLVLATGFQAGRWLHGIEVVGRGGRRLQDAWDPWAVAYLGMAVHGFPNLFVLYGPNTNQGGNSIILILEAQASYVRSALAAMDEAGAAAVDVTQAAQDRYDAELQDALGETVWATGCRSYFTDADGRVVTQLPWTSSAYAARTSTFALEDYEVSPSG